MKYHIILVLIALFWFTEGIVLGYISQDIALQEISTNLTYNTSTYNTTTQFFNSTDSDEGNKASFLRSTLGMFVYRLDENLFPPALDGTIKFINWILVLLLIICVYRIANPLA